MNIQDRINIFKDTTLMCETDVELIEAIEFSNKNQKIIPQNDKLPQINKDKHNKVCNLVVSKKRTFEAAQSYAKRESNNKVAVLNFASAVNPGGGVLHGSRAQEECLCRCSTLYFNLDIDEMWNKFYLPHRKEGNPIHNDDLLYTPKVKVFKEDSQYPKTMNKKDWYNVDVITCAAPNLRENPSNIHNEGDGISRAIISDEELYKVHINRFKRILNVAAINNCDVVILGAFGCGAFMNNPWIVAEAARVALNEFLYTFETVEFAIFCNEWDTENYDIFKEVLEKIKKNL